MNALIVVYSRDGSCVRTAEAIAERIGGAEIRRLEEAKERHGFFGFLRSGFQAATRRPAKLVGDPWQGLEPGRHVYLVAPIWAGKPNPAIRAFLEGCYGVREAPHDATLRGTSVHLVTVQADQKHGRAQEVHDELSELVVRAGGTVLETAALTGASPGKTSPDDEIHRQVAAVIAMENDGVD